MTVRPLRLLRDLAAIPLLFLVCLAVALAFYARIIIEFGKLISNVFRRSA